MKDTVRLTKIGESAVGAIVFALSIVVPSQSGEISSRGGPFVRPADRLGIAEPASLPKQPEQAVPGFFLELPRGSPLPEYEITGEFGMRRDPLTNKRAMHTGVDLAAPYRSYLFVTSAGVVTFAGWAGAYGKLVEVDHGNGVTTRYGHLSSMMVRKDQKLARGDLIGRLGSTGRTTGPHVHYEILIAGVARDPADLLRADDQLASELETSP